MDVIRPKVGRPPKRAPDGGLVSLTVRLLGEDKNFLIEQSDALDLTITEYLTALLRRERGVG